MAAQFKITGQSTRPTFDNNARPVDVFDISFEVMPHGDRGMVSIPVNQYTAESVLAAIQPLADQMEAVRNLGKG